MVKLTLLQLSLGVGGGPLAFAPHIWKTVMDMRLLGISYDTEFVVSAQLEKELPERFGLEKVTIPSLLIRQDDGTQHIIVDSFDIAHYLEKNYSTPGKSLFCPGGSSIPESIPMGLSYARFIEHWVNLDFANIIRPALLAPAFALFSEDGPADAASRARFESKVGPDRMRELSELTKDAVWKEDVYTRARKELLIVDTMLRDRERIGEPGPFLSGQKPTHADFVLFAFYPYSLTNPDLVKNVWRHADLPYINKWLDALFSTGLVSHAELLPYDG